MILLSKSSSLLADYTNCPNKRLDLSQLALPFSYIFCHFALLRKSVSLKQELVLNIEKKNLVFNKINTVKKVRNPNCNK